MRINEYIRWDGNIRQYEVRVGTAKFWINYADLDKLVYGLQQALEGQLGKAVHSYPCTKCGHETYFIIQRHLNEKKDCWETKAKCWRCGKEVDWESSD